jgi:hypothetical protein
VVSSNFLNTLIFWWSFFTDVRPVKDMCDDRLIKLRISYNWLKSWENEGCQNETASKRYKSLLTMETREDLALKNCIRKLFQRGLIVTLLKIYFVNKDICTMDLQQIQHTIHIELE